MIKKPFAYMGDKMRFYKEIKTLFIESKKNAYVDLFARGLAVATNLKNELDIKVIANVKDKAVEAMLKIDTVTIYKRVIETLHQKDYDRVENAYNTEEWEKIKLRYKKCIFALKEDEREVIKLLCSINKSSSLSSRYYSKLKAKNLTSYLKAVDKIDVIGNDLFNKNLIFKDAFILLDPLILRAQVKKGKDITMKIII